MVQRKAVNKLGIKAESSNVHAASTASLKPYHQHPDSRNKGGGEIKKKMKKSRSFKSSDFESLRSPTGRDQPRFKKHSADVSNAAAAFQQKASPVKTSCSSPNYMKPTSSSDARRESLQLEVSTQSRTHDRNKSPRNSNRSKTSPSSVLKPMKVLVRKSSFKPARPSMKKSCGVALNSDLDLRRGTCSSTLKDSKFPMYVDLHPGGTESEGTSVMKVCPYTYCSLNGRHHVPALSLTRFLSARRRLLKTQKSMKLKGLSGERLKEIDTGQMVFDGEPLILESDLAGSPLSPVKQVYSDFFVEFFAKQREETAESVNYGDARKICDGHDDPKIDFTETTQVLKETSSDGDDEIPPPSSSESTETYIEDDGDAESQFKEPNAYTSGGDNLSQSSSISVKEMDVSMTLLEGAQFDQEKGVQDTENLAYWIQEDQVEKSSECCIESDAGKETEIISGGIDADASVSDATEMELEEEEAPYFDDGIDYSMFSDSWSISITAQLAAHEDPHKLACDSNDSVNTCAEETEKTIILQEACEEDIESVSTLFGGAAYGCTHVKLDDGEENLEINEPSDTSEECSVQMCSIIYNTNFTASPEVAFGNSAEADQNNTYPEHDYYFSYEHAPLKDDTKEDQVTATREPSSGYQYPGADSTNPQLNEPDDKGVLEGQTSDTVESEMDLLVTTFHYSQEQVLRSADVGDAAERNEGNDSNGLLKIQNLSETGQDTSNDDHTAEYKNMETELCQSDGSISQEKKCLQELIDPKRNTPDQIIPLTTQSTFDDQPGTHNMDKNQDSEKNQGEFEYLGISKTTCFEECDDSDRYGSISKEDCIATDNKMQTEDKPMMGTEESCVAAANFKIAEKNKTISAGTDDSIPLPETCSNLKGKPRMVGKRPIENSEQFKKFNPRAPHYLDPEPVPEAEKVDLKHQMMDERKNAEEWMIDYALQQAVTKLAPARKRRVALLVEAFETVTQVPKYEAHLRHSAPSFTHSRPIQACS